MTGRRRVAVLASGRGSNLASLVSAAADPSYPAEICGVIANVAGAAALTRAAEAGLPFAALRVISDPATRALPALAVNAVKPNGNIDVPAVLRGIIRNPSVVRALVTTGRDFSRALRSLRGCQPALILQRSSTFAQAYHNRNHAAARHVVEAGSPVVSSIGPQFAAAGS